jgi:phenylacetate-CoA ligase
LAKMLPVENKGNTYKLDKWIKEKIGDKSKDESFDRNKLKEFQLKKIRDTIFSAKTNSLFYQKLLKHINPENISDFEDLQKIPFTTERDIINNGLGFLCTNPNNIHRIVTLNTSGTSGTRKRIFFTEEDQELTKDYFNHGMRTIVDPGDWVLILMPAVRPGSVGDLLSTALRRFDCCGIPYGPVDDYDQVLNMILNQNIEGIVGNPIQVYRLARLKEFKYPYLKTKLKCILLSSDYASPTLILAIKNGFQCDVFDHYGMTEMGLGGGLECRHHSGYHMREADMYFEIIDPDTKKTVPDGSFGEIVFTTLTRKGMPLIRYRTGDYSKFINQPCSCGTNLKTLQRISFRLGQEIFINRHMLTINMLDDLLFNHIRLLDYEAVLTKEENKNCLTIFAEFLGKGSDSDFDELHRIFKKSDLISKLMSRNDFIIKFVSAGQKTEINQTAGKRKIIDLRNSLGAG